MKAPLPGLSLLVLTVALAACDGGGGGGGSVNTNVGGSISGLNATGLVLANGNDTLNVPATMTTFTMPTAVASGAAYNVVVRSHPVNVRCTVSNGSGKGGDSAVSNISVTCGPASLSTLYSFGAEDGELPSNGLIQGSDGNLYGTKPDGGAYGGGTVFRITPAGEHTVLWSFGASDGDGNNPQAALVQGSDGNLYGTTFYGGAYGAGTIFRITPAGEYTVLWSFAGNDTPGRFPFGLMQASDGNFYGMTYQGGAQDLGIVFRLTPSGTLTQMASFAPDNEGPAGPDHNGLIQGRDGNLYGMTYSGGYGAWGTFFRMTLDGAVTKLVTFDSNNGANPTGNPIEASDGNFYGLTSYGDVNRGGNLFRVTPSGEMSILHTFGSSGDDGRAPTGGLIEDADGNLYGMTCDYDVDSGTIFRFDRSGTVTTLYSLPGGGPTDFCPEVSLLKSADGTLYGVTSDDGTNGGTVFQIN